jgi:glutathione S-transferase
MASPSLIVHHLQNGQGERIPWLLEELNIPYDLRLYQRAPLLSPPELKAKYPTGASPVLEDLTDSSNPIIMAESGAIRRRPAFTSALAQEIRGLCVLAAFQQRDRTTHRVQARHESRHGWRE